MGMEARRKSQPSTVPGYPVTAFLAVSYWPVPTRRKLKRCVGVTVVLAGQRDTTAIGRGQTQ